MPSSKWDVRQVKAIEAYREWASSREDCDGDATERKLKQGCLLQTAEDYTGRSVGGALGQEAWHEQRRRGTRALCLNRKLKRMFVHVNTEHGWCIERNQTIEHTEWSGWRKTQCAGPTLRCRYPAQA